MTIDSRDFYEDDKTSFTLNEWLEKNPEVEIINIETLWQNIAGMGSNLQENGIRIWYKVNKK
ncbi:MAG: hypothetical protein COB67_02550 [SAR324 cluster bacterium]|uniref:Uncharacterized protein n=1 Tax=SAR324 cluster bacterium TaxID=2024889 RepID=A0A2A4TAN2_9DELT|nr:MAG: hypothetical protein COB67_02550 [SAR324 cluster bacterium]